MDEQEEVDDLVLEEDFALALVVLLTILQARLTELCRKGFTFVAQLVRRD